MVIATVLSKNKIPIRLTHERWLHIIASHLEIDPTDYKTIMNVIKNPDIILKGDTGEFLAVKKRARKNMWFVVPYKEIDKTDGFVLTAYLTTNISWLLQRELIWNKKS